MPVYYGVAAPLYHRQHMQQITLSQTLPHVFRDLTDLRSEVWLSQQTFHRGEYYLIEATSGAGKSYEGWTPRLGERYAALLLASSFRICASSRSSQLGRMSS